MGATGKNMSNFDFAGLLLEIESFALEINASLRAEVRASAHQTEEALLACYAQLGLSKPSIVWLSNPYQLWYAPIIVNGFSRSLRLLEVTNSTAEPDGSFKKYYLRVPPRVLTALEAVAWTFDMRADEYDPVIES